jgi:glycosyltransferase involved in cell wall biosynthesis
MRVLLVEPDLEENGAIRVSLDRARRWSALGADVRVLFVSSHAESEPVALPDGLPATFANHRLRSARWMVPNALRVGLPLAWQTDVVVAGREMASGLLISTLLAKLARRPLAVTVHSNVDAALTHHGTPRHRRNVLRCLKLADRLVAVSGGLVPGLAALGIAENRISVVENGLNLLELQARAAEVPGRELGPDPVIMGLGRLSEQKGFDLLIRAHARALAQGAPRHRLLIGGHGPDQGALSGLAAELGVADTVDFTGFLSNPYPVLARACLFVLSSRWEGFSLALTEALALGVPAVATDCVSGPADILADGRFGDLVRVDDEAALAEAIARHLRDPQRLQAAARAGSEHVRQRFTAERAAERHLEVLQAMVPDVARLQPAARYSAAGS